VACMALRSRDTDVTDPWRSGGRILENDVDTLWRRASPGEAER
jgi:hypothetical protein